MNTQFKKGLIELCVLVLVGERDYYGYELVNKISMYIPISEGTVYPLLRRLTKEGYAQTYLRASEEGPDRKYYQLTSQGRTYRDELLRDWHVFHAGLVKLLKERD